MTASFRFLVKWGLLLRPHTDKLLFYAGLVNEDPRWTNEMEPLNCINHL